MAPSSSQPYRKGQEVLRCEPFAYVVNTEYLNAVCDYCLRNTIKEENEGIKNASGDLDKCPKCEVVYYCNSICQKKAWDNYHDKECAYIRKLHPQYYKGYWFKNKNFAWWQCNATVPPSGILDIIRFMARIMLKLNLHGGDKDFVELPDGRKRYFQDLMSHHEKIVKDYRKLLEAMDADLRDCLGNELVPSLDDVMDIYGKVKINSHSIEYGGKIIGRGLYLDASVLDHSCAPNTSWIYNGKEMIITATDTINDFADCRITYISYLARSTRERRQDLLKNYYFYCDCSKCQDIEADALKSSILFVVLQVQLLVLNVINKFKFIHY